MRSVSRLFDVLTDPEHIDRAITLTTRGKRRRPDVAWFLFERDRHALRIRDALERGEWRPAGFDRLYVHDPKPRVIARAGIGDRVVHTAIAELCTPVFLRSASNSDFACRKGFGTHRAVLALLAAMRAHRFVVHLDVRAYFPSIRIEVLRRLLAQRIHDPRFLDVVDRVLEAGRGFFDPPRIRRFARLPQDWPPTGEGLPMGSVTSQLFAAHVYLQAFDHWVKRELRVPHYVRYVDDLFVFGDGRAELRSWREAIGDWLFGERGLRLKHPRARILSCAGHLDGLGHRIRRSGIEPLPRAWERMRRRVVGYLRDGNPDAAALGRSMRSAMGLVFLF